MTTNTATRSSLPGLLIFLSIPIALYAFVFQSGMAGGTDFHERFATMPVFAACHILGSGVALLLGGFQFLPALRRRRPELHRWLGRTYLVAVCAGGIGGLVLASNATGGLVARVGFSGLGIVWLYSGWQACAAIRRRDIRSHQRWMVRNFALTFAAVTLRIYLGLSEAAGIPFQEFYPVVAWLCWVPNLILVEWLLLSPLNPVPPGRL
ncbi:MAG: DUF2306 domain-containing protein [Pseudomonadales bacterium]|nr:DUF2306 domain-containing protein [Pseudomonadales bacterium]